MKLITFIKSNMVLVGVIAVLIVYAIGVTKWGHGVNLDRNRLKNNQNALMSDVKFYKTSDSLNAASVQALFLKKNEFEKHNSDLLETISDLNLKVKRLQSISETATRTEYVIKTEVKDSIVYRDGKEVVLKCIDFEDVWWTAVGCAENGVFKGKVESKDTIDTFIHRVPHKFLFFKYGTKAVMQEVVNKNPHTEIVYTKYIEFTK